MNDVRTLAAIAGLLFASAIVGVALGFVIFLVAITTWA